MTTPAKTPRVRPATIYDVARAAGVSHQTVTRLLRGFEGIRPETRERVERALAELEYRPNSAARLLRGRHTNRIGAIVQRMEMSGPGRIVAGATAAARERGYVLDVVALDGRGEEGVSAAIELLLGQQIAGILVTSSTEDVTRAVERFGVPVPVALGAAAERPTGGEVVNERAGAIQAAHLASLGHRRVAYVSGEAGWQSTDERRDGFRGECATRGVEIVMEIEGDWTPASGFAAGSALDVDACTALACANDAMALGALAALSGRGLRVPDDLSVIGIDDSPEARYLVPSLSSVAMEFEGEGAHVVTELIARIEGHPSQGVVPMRPLALHPRASTAAPRG